MAKFNFMINKPNDRKSYSFTGINPSGITFSRQTSSTCWAASLINARAILQHKSDLTDQDIVSHVFADNHVGEYGKCMADIIEIITEMADLTGVMLYDKQALSLHDYTAVELLHTFVENGMPVMIFSLDKQHVVLALAYTEGDQFLVYNSQTHPDGGKPTGIPEWAKSGGLEITSIGDFGKSDYIVGLIKSNS